jgi:hypothetical protein
LLDHLTPPSEDGRLEALVGSAAGVGQIPAFPAALPRASITSITSREDRVSFGLPWREDRRTTLVDAFLAMAQGERGRVAARSPRLVRV